MAGEIPIRNVYALLAFHWRSLGIEPPREIGEVDADTPQELLARVLIAGTRAQLRRGLYREYIEHEEDLRLPRGAFDVDGTLRRNLRVRGRLHCRFDELVPDVPANRLIKAGLRLVGSNEAVPDGVRRMAHGLVAQLSAVSDAPLASLAAANIPVPRTARSYAPLLDVCRMLARWQLPDQALHGQQFREIALDDRELARLFEGFVRGFAQYHLGSRFDVRVTHPPWANASGESDALALLPRMQTDVSVTGPHGLTVLETKFVRRPFREFEDPDRIKLRSGHLYQLFAYITNLARQHPTRRVAGGLIYASVGRGLAAELSLHGQPVWVRTVDLTLPWTELEQVMLAIVQRSREPHVAATPGVTSLVPAPDQVRASTDLQVGPLCPG